MHVRISKFANYCSGQFRALQFIELSVKNTELNCMKKVHYTFLEVNSNPIVLILTPTNHSDSITPSKSIFNQLA